MKTSIERVTTFGIVSLMLVVSLLSAGTASAKDGVHQDRMSARAADTAILANETGLPIDRVEQAITFQEAFAQYADELMIRFPDQISSVWAEPVPNTKGHIEFIAEIPSELTAAMERGGILNQNNLILTGGGRISMADHTRRVELAAETLAAMGYQNVVAFFDPAGKVIRVELKLPDGTGQPNKSGIVNAMQERVKSDRDKHGQPRLQGRAATVDASEDIDITTMMGSGPIVTEQHSRGGNWLRDDGIRECTSGWSVSGPSGDGIITAAHCTGLNQFEEPGVAPYAMTFRKSVYGPSGDVEYHTTSHNELDDFYADSINIRDVVDIRTTNTMVGSSVCVYGRASNVRTCNHIVEAVGVVSSGIGNQVRVSGATTIGGDSGAGWSIYNTAFGTHRGIDGSDNAYFIPVQAAQTALGVTIKLQ